MPRGPGGAEVKRLYDSSTLPIRGIVKVTATPPVPPGHPPVPVTFTIERQGLPT